MNKLPIVSGKECIAALEKAKFYVKRRESSHVILMRDDPFARVVVPDLREIDLGTLRAIIRQTGLSVDEFMLLL